LKHHLKIVTALTSLSIGHYSLLLLDFGVFEATYKLNSNSIV